ncbi:hypothetical protein ACI01nite_22310 [Acetobacter cibinongensis]|uniref:FAD dependent oxidoreductase n=1 Tax=Acetobacter cibinongensis TaxID=146475 RepID=A0A0D6N7N1_9PROT|nr:FAD-binding oxidoreductase [Acetobacter cibinongensis]GAN61501.1 FAD dependent oxidoreductase [Acetobacter cibinongensis]GBQ14316.1 glycine/D-amino acid oxidase [Acetobacter cibinongensis NRIC 0482]GEL59629.1 hypothetical protein ACI01nite_22310 [Acetobacter cibinongensis]
MLKVNFLPNDDAECGWYHTSRKRQVTASASGVCKTRWTIIGAGFTGLAAARQLARNFPNDKIVLVEAQEVGFGASGRNAGFAIDLPHDIGAEDYIGDLATANLAMKLNHLGQTTLKTEVENNNIDCHLRQSGKYQAAIENRGMAVLEAYQRGLDKLGQPYTVIDGEDLPDHIGTSFYRKALFTPGTILVQPSALVKGLADTLPENVTLYEHTVISGVDYGEKTTLFHENGSIVTDKLILANNVFGPQFGFLQRTLLPIFLYGSLTRPLTEDEKSKLGGKEFWGVIPADTFGTTLRRTHDDRIFVRNTFSFNPNGQSNPKHFKRALKHHRLSFSRRFPMLDGVGFDYSWSGCLAMAQNHEGFFGQLAPNVYGAFGCNGLGVTRGTATGKLLADWLAGETNDLTAYLLASPGPSKVPSEPFLSLGVNATLRWGEFKAGKEA